MRILIAASLQDLGEPSDRAAREVRLRLAASGADAVIVLARDLDWSRIRATDGGWEGAYRWAARVHDTLVCVPTSPGDGAWPLSKGVATMAQEAIRLGNRAAVWMENAPEGAALRRVGRVVMGGRGADWKRAAAMAIEEGREVEVGEAHLVLGALAQGGGDS